MVIDNDKHVGEHLGAPLLELLDEHLLLLDDRLQVCGAELLAEAIIIFLQDFLSEVLDRLPHRIDADRRAPRVDVE